MSKTHMLKELSDWQALRVRNALRVYHRYERREDDEGQYFSWRDVREAVLEYTDYAIGGSSKNGPKNGAERLRQFVEGLESKDRPGTRSYPHPKPDAVAAIVSFLTHKDIDLLSESELEEYAPPQQAPLRLLEFFRQDCDTIPTIHALELQSTASALTRERDGWMVVSISLERPSDDGFLQVTETREMFDAKDRSEARKLSVSEPNKRLSLVKFSGWAVITPEDRLMMFLKHAGDGRNHSYVCLNDIGMAVNQSAEYIYLQRQDFGFEMDKELLGSKEALHHVLEELEPQVLMCEFQQDFLSKTKGGIA